jgi:LAS superfamily LD-carboxypeptidase LdcB
MTKSIIFLLLIGLGSLSFSCSDAPSPAGERTVKATAAPLRDPEFDLAYLMGRFDPAKHPDFTKISAPYSERADMYLRKDAYTAFQEMYTAAQKDGITLKIISAARNFEVQKGIWEAKWNGTRILSNGENAAKAYPKPADRAIKIMEYSAMPGASRHHWGTDIDLNNLSDKWFLQGEGQKVYAWLRANASKFGYCQPYSPKDAQRPQGYNEEKWHWTYLPVSQKLTTFARKQMTDKLITGFSGAETAVEIGVVEKYVLGINHQCQ